MTAALVEAAPDTASTAAVRRLVRAVSVVSVRDRDALHAVTLDSLALLSPDPARVVLAVRPDSRWWVLASRSGWFGASILSVGQEPIGLRFASRSRGTGAQQFAGVSWRPAAVSGAPLLTGAAGWFEAAIEGAVEVGHQLVVIGKLSGEAGHDPRRTLLLRGG